MRPLALVGLDRAIDHVVDVLVLLSVQLAQHRLSQLRVELYIRRLKKGNVIALLRRLRRSRVSLLRLSECGIELYGGVSGNADAAVDAYLDDNLSYDPDVKCNHHDHERSDASHACKSHGCGKGNCGNR